MPKRDVEKLVEIVNSGISNSQTNQGLFTMGAGKKTLLSIKGFLTFVGIAASVGTFTVILHKLPEGVTAPTLSTTNSTEPIDNSKDILWSFSAEYDPDEAFRVTVPIDTRTKRILREGDQLLLSDLSDTASLMEMGGVLTTFLLD